MSNGALSFDHSPIGEQETVKGVSCSSAPWSIDCCVSRRARIFTSCPTDHRIAKEPLADG